MSNDWGIVEYPGPAGLRQLEGDWRRLVAEMPDRGWHHTWQHARAHADHLGRGPDGYTCLALRDGERVRAICPLELKPLHILGRDTRVWGLPGDLQTLVRDVVCPPDEAQRELLPRVVQFLRGAPDRPAWLVFDRVKQGSALWRCLAALEPSSYCTDTAGATDAIDCTRPYEELSLGLARKFRSNLRNARRKLEQLGDVRFKVAADASSVGPAFASFLALEASGWKGGGGTGTAIGLDQRLAAFYRDLSVTAGADARCEIHSLHAAGRLLAALFCLRTGEEFAVLKTCYDESYARMAPGQLLLERALERCCANEGISRLSLVSHTDWTQVWRPRVVPLYDVYVGLRLGSRLLLPALRLRFAYGPRLKRGLRRLRERGPREP